MKKDRFIPLIVVAVALLAYYNSFTGPFIFDDLVSIRDNRSIRHLWPLWNALSPPHGRGSTVEGRPVLNLSLAVNYAFCGATPRGYHVINLAIHILAGLTLFGITRRTLLQNGISTQFRMQATFLALGVAVLWTVHPLQTEAVTYVAQRAESLMGLFYQLTLYCFIRGVKSRKSARWYALSVTACLLGMGTKEVMVSAPLMVLLYDWLFVADSFREAWKKRWPLYAGLSTTWVLLGYLVATGSNRGGTAGFGGEVTWWPYAMTQCRAIVHYLRLSVWPYPLVFDYGTTTIKNVGQALPYAVVLLALIVGTVIALYRRCPLGFLGAWFFAILAPSSSVLPVTTQTIAEHRMYLPLATVVSLIVLGIHALLGRRDRVVFAALAEGLCFMTWQRNEDYRSDLAIWSDTLKKVPDNVRAHNNLAIALFAAGREKEALPHFEESLRIRPEWAETHFNLGNALSQSGKPEEAIRQYEEAVRITPNYADAQFNMGEVLLILGRTEEAVVHYQEALRIDPDYAQAHCRLGNVLARSGRLEDAIVHYERALQIEPGYSEARLNLGAALARLGRTEEAISQYEETIRLQPNYVPAYNSLANALVRVGKIDDAIQQYQQALGIEPGSAEIHCNLGIVFQRAGRAPEAIEQYKQALQLKPDLIQAQKALARLQVAR